MASLSTVQHDYQFKVVVIGDSGTGKTNLLSRFTKDQFTLDSRTTIGVDFATHLTTIQGKVVKAQIWDTAGQERYRVVAAAFYRGAVGTMLVYDVTRRGTFTSVADWLKEVREHANPNAVCLLVGNKSDLGHLRAVSTEEGALFAAKHGMKFIETSALDKSNVKEAFDSVVGDIFDAIEANPTLAKAVGTNPPGKGTTLDPRQELAGMNNKCSC